HRRTEAVDTRRAAESGGSNGSDGLGVLDAAAIEKVQKEAWPEATNADELHDALMLLGLMTPEEVARTVSIQHEANGATAQPDHIVALEELVSSRRATQLRFRGRT